MKRVIKISIIVAGLAVGMVSSLCAEDVALPYTFSAGETAKASEVNANFNTLKNALNSNQKGLISYKVITLSCHGSSGTTYESGVYSKVDDDIGTFTTNVAGSVVEVQMNGSFYFATMNGTGGKFELRVDDNPTNIGWARIALKKDSQFNKQVFGTITALFPNLSVGEHTISIWAEGAGGTAIGAYIDPGCWSTAHIVVKEMK